MPRLIRSMRSFKRKFSARDRKGYQARMTRQQALRRKIRASNITYKRANAITIAGQETKTAMFTINDNQVIGHNNFIYLENSLFAMRPGYTSNDFNPSGSGSGAKGFVVGARYFAKGVSFRFMLENPADRPYVIYRFMVIKAAHGNNPTRADLFENVSGNKMIDYIDTDKYTVEYQKWIHVRAPNAGTQAAKNINGTYNAGDFAGNETVMTTPKKVVKLYWKCNKHIRLHDYADKETIDGLADRLRPKNFNHYVLLYAYDTYGTPQDLTTVGTVNDYVSKVYMKDY